MHNLFDRAVETVFYTATTSALPDLFFQNILFFNMLFVLRFYCSVTLQRFKVQNALCVFLKGTKRLVHMKTFKRQPLIKSPLCGGVKEKNGSLGLFVCYWPSATLNC